MAAILASLLGLFSRSVLGQQISKFTNVFGIPFPDVFHKTLSSEFVDKFDEILIIGDVHGCFDEMALLIRDVSQGEYSASKILKIFVGDLVNKGNKHRDVIKYMIANSADCLSVRGNHDEVVIREYLKLKKGEELKPRNSWMKELTDDEVNYLVSLPYSISIPSLSILIVHAGVIPGVPLEDTDPSHLISMRNLICEDEGKFTATKDDKIGSPWSSLWPGPQHIYFGHDAKRMLQKSEFSTGLDTGCVYGKQLTGVFVKGPRASTFVHVNALNVYEKPGG
ncbi:Bis(5'-nucleosyl)-tetraphosphatase, symmetrical [Halotydeus destructor]|nr:Bis(5'-nucleosyl)-tetraphosphatase, symmetrical [Halotydeus destructor]